MKFDKWTIALAALGVVSLASVAGAEEKTSAVMTTLSSTTISGYVDTSAQWNFGTGNVNLPPYRFGGPSKADGFNLDVVQLRIERPLDESQWAAGYRADLWLGPDAKTLGPQSNLAGDSGDFAIRQAYVALRAPMGNGLDFKVGVFDSVVGYETIESPSDPNYTRSWGNTIEPTTHTGLLASYRFTDLISASAGVANTVGPQINGRASAPYGPDAESYKTYMGSLALTAPDSMGFLAGSTLYGGVVNGFSDSYEENLTSWYVGSTLATPVTGLRVGAAFDLLNVHNMSGETWSVGGYASYQATEKLSFHGRAEYLRDRGDQKFFVDDLGNALNPERVMSITLTTQYDLWQNVISRVELRWDHSASGADAWGGENEGDPTLKNAWMLAANIIYRF
jgi:hypothetical protein